MSTGRVVCASSTTSRLEFSQAYDFCGIQLDMLVFELPNFNLCKEWSTSAVPRECSQRPAAGLFHDGFRLSFSQLEFALKFA